MMKLGIVIKTIQKYMNQMVHHLSSADISNFRRKSENFAISRNTDIDCILTYNLILLIFLQSLNIVLINMVTILMMSAKMATPGLLKIKLF